MNKEKEKFAKLSQALKKNLKKKKITAKKIKE